MAQQPQEVDWRCTDSADQPAADSRLGDSFTHDVLNWGVPLLRDFPWRNTRDPWSILVSEVMLQQTQAGRVVDRWHRFLDRFATFEHCAAAPLADVLVEWQGLGFPRRAKYLHLAAQRLTALGGFPNELAGLLELPGVGPYTARAVLAFSFELDTAVVDTNIARIYARVVGERLTPSGVQALADSAVPSGEAWLWNQVLMDLGAMLCRPGAPACDECPVRRQCGWRGSDRPDPAVGSSGVSGKQSRFQGSDRQARGALMKALAAGPVDPAGQRSVSGIMDRDVVTSGRLVDDLIAEGLVELVDGAEGQLLRYRR